MGQKKTSEKSCNKGIDKYISTIMEIVDISINIINGIIKIQVHLIRFPDKNAKLKDFIKLL